MALVLTLVDLTSMILALGRWGASLVFFLILGLPGGRTLGGRLRPGRYAGLTAGLFNAALPP